MLPLSEIRVEIFDTQSPVAIIITFPVFPATDIL